MPHIFNAKRMIRDIRERKHINDDHKKKLEDLLYETNEFKSYTKEQENALRRLNLLTRRTNNHHVNKLKKGGSIKTLSPKKKKEVVNKIADYYEGKEVKPEYQKLYGKRYSRQEAKIVGDKIINKMKSNKKVLRQGGSTNDKWVVYVDNDQKIIGTYNTHKGAKIAMSRAWNTNKYESVGVGLKKDAYSEEYYKEGGKVEVINAVPQEIDKTKYAGIYGDFDKDGLKNADDSKPTDKTITDKVEKEIEIKDVFDTILDTREILDSKVKKVVTKLKSVAPEDSKIYYRTKTPYSIINKLVKEKMLNSSRAKEGDVKGLTDLVGTAIVVKDKDSIDVVSHLIDKGLIGEVIERKDYYKTPKAGYRAIHYITLYDNIPIEVQLKTQRQKSLNEASHLAYKKENLNADLLLQMSSLADKADNGNKEAIKEYDEFFEGKTKHELEEMFMTKKKNGGMIYGAGIFEGGGQSQELPEELDRYFVKTPNTKKIALEDLIPIRAREKGIANAEKYMRMAYDGNMDRRKPISVSKFGDKYMVEDGNSTFAVAKKNGWEYIYAEEVDSLAFGGNLEKDYEDWEMVVLTKDKNGKSHKYQFLVSAKNIAEAKSIATDLWQKNFRDMDETFYKVMSESKYRMDYGFEKGGYMANGGEMEGVDLFEDYEDQPEEVSAILSKYELEDNDYDVLEQLLSELKEIGYTFEYGLDGEPYDLRKIGQKGKSEFYAKGGYMADGGKVNSQNMKSAKLDMKDFIGKKITIELGSSGETQVWNEEDFLKQIGKVLLHNLYDTDFAYSEFTDIGDIYRKNVINSDVLPLIQVDEINKTLNHFFKYDFTPYSSREKVLFFKLNRKDTQKWIDNWFETTQNNPPKVIKMDELKKEYYYFRLDYAGEKPYILERGGYMADGGKVNTTKYNIVDDGVVMKSNVGFQEVIDYANTLAHYDLMDESEFGDFDEIVTLNDAMKYLHMVDVEVIEVAEDGKMLDRKDMYVFENLGSLKEDIEELLEIYNLDYNYKDSKIMVVTTLQKINTMIGDIESVYGDDAKNLLITSGKKVLFGKRNTQEPNYVSTKRTIGRESPNALFPQSIMDKLFENYKYGSDFSKQDVVVKIFNPAGIGTWYVMNSDPDDPNYMYGIVDLFEIEAGGFSKEELETIRIKPFNIGLERDKSFKPMNALELFEGLQEGKTYKLGGNIEYKQKEYKPTDNLVQ